MITFAEKVLTSADGIEQTNFASSGLTYGASTIEARFLEIVPGDGFSVSVGIEKADCILYIFCERTFSPCNNQVGGLAV